MCLFASCVNRPDVENLLAGRVVKASPSRGFDYTTREKVLDIGPIHATREETHNIPIPPIAGGLALVGAWCLWSLAAGPFHTPGVTPALWANGEDLSLGYFIRKMVARDRIELSTLRFSVVCSTN